jgi:hypothetical protein
MENINIGYIDIPYEYMNYSKLKRKAICNFLIDKILRYLDEELPPTINRIDFLNEIFDSTIETNIEDENYEVAAVIRDCKKFLNEE